MTTDPSAPPTRRTQIGVLVTVGLIVLAGLGVAGLAGARVARTLYPGTHNFLPAPSIGVLPVAPSGGGTVVSSVTITNPLTLVGEPETTWATAPYLLSQIDRALAVIPTGSSVPAGMYGGNVLYMRVATDDSIPPFAAVVRSIRDRTAGAGYVTLAPGRLGGSAGAFSGTVGGLDAAICVWQDSYDVTGVLMFFDHTPQDVQADFVTARGQIETIS